MALVRKRRRRVGTKAGGVRKSARRAYKKAPTRRRRRNGTAAGQRRKTARKAYRTTKRRNPGGQANIREWVAQLSPGYKKQYKGLRARGFNTTDAAAEIQKTWKKRRKKRGSKKRKSRKKAVRVGASKARLRSWRKVAGTKVRRTKKGKIYGGRGRRSIAKASLSANAAFRRLKSGKMKKGEADFLAATGLKARRNPSLTSTLGDVWTLAPMITATAASVVGFTVLGNKAAQWLAPRVSGAPAIIKTNITPITTFTLTAVAWTVLKNSKMSKWSLPVLLGGMSAAILQWMISSQIGKSLSAKLGYSVKETKPDNLTQSEAQDPDHVEVAVEQAAKDDATGNGNGGLSGAEWGMGEYTPVSQYMGDYVDSGPSEAFGEYTASNYPLHSPGPGDNRSVHGELIQNQAIFPRTPPPAVDPWRARAGHGFSGFGDYGYTTQKSGVYDPRLPSVDNTLLNTPGGTIVTGGEFQSNTASGDMLGEGVLAGSDRW